MPVQRYVIIFITTTSTHTTGGNENALLRWLFSIFPRYDDPTKGKSLRDMYHIILCFTPPRRVPWRYVIVIILLDYSRRRPPPPRFATTTSRPRDRPIIINIFFVIKIKKDVIKFRVRFQMLFARSLNLCAE